MDLHDCLSIATNAYACTDHEGYTECMATMQHLSAVFTTHPVCTHHPVSRSESKGPHHSLLLCMLSRQGRQHIPRTLIPRPHWACSLAMSHTINSSSSIRTGYWVTATAGEPQQEVLAGHTDPHQQCSTWCHAGVWLRQYCSGVAGAAAQVANWIIVINVDT